MGPDKTHALLQKNESCSWENVREVPFEAQPSSINVESGLTLALVIYARMVDMGNVSDTIDMGDAPKKQGNK